jgi:hypothetical protein
LEIGASGFCTLRCWALGWVGGFRRIPAGDGRTMTERGPNGKGRKKAGSDRREVIAGARDK